MNSNIDPYWNRLVSTGLRFLQEQGNLEAVTVIKNAILNVEFNGHDDWDGGINYWDLVFQLRYRDYIAIAAKKEKIEGEILKILEAFHTDGRNCLANVIIRPKIEQYIDWNAIFPATKESTINLIMKEQKMLSDVATGKISFKEDGIVDTYQERINLAYRSVITNRSFIMKSSIQRMLMCLLIVFLLIGSMLTVDAYASTILVSAKYEQGRYTVANGGAVSSNINIRTSDFIEARRVSLDIPSQYSVTIHQYRSRNVKSFIESKTGLSGIVSEELNQETNFIRLSIKKRNNSYISPDEGQNIKIYRITSGIETDPTHDEEWEYGRYAVGTGRRISSDVNIRSKQYIAATNNTIKLQIPSGYTVSVHEYSGCNNSSFIKSESGLKGDASVVLSPLTQFVKFSFKKTNNSTITLIDGDKLSYLFVDGQVTEAHKAMLTIIDDDGNIKYYTDIYPLAKEKNISIATAVPASSVGKSNHLTWDMIGEIQNSGIEVLCHTYGHPLSTKIDSMTEDDFRTDYSKAKEIFNAHGIDADLLVFSGSTGLHKKAQIPAQETFKGAFLAGDNNTNQSGTNPYKIKRYRIGSNYAWDVQTLEKLIDSLKETGGWMVWMMHTSDKSNYTSNVPVVLGEVIDYCKDQGIPIVTAEYGFTQWCR